MEEISKIQEKKEEDNKSPENPINANPESVNNNPPKVESLPPAVEEKKEEKKEGNIEEIVKDEKKEDIKTEEAKKEEKQVEEKKADDKKEEEKKIEKKEEIKKEIFRDTPSFQGAKVEIGSNIPLSNEENLDIEISKPKQDANQIKELDNPINKPLPNKNDNNSNSLDNPVLLNKVNADKALRDAESDIGQQEDSTDVLAKTRIDNVIVKVVQNNIVNEKVDAIVNAANNHLAYGGGVAGAIADAGGVELENDTRKAVEKIGGYVDTGDALATKGNFGSLKCLYIIHAVGPSSRSADATSRKQLASAIHKVLELTDKNKLKSVSIPAVSSGIFGFPKELCAEIMIKTVENYIKENPKTRIKEIRLTNFDYPTCSIFKNKFISKFNSK